MSCPECHGAGTVRRYIGHEGRAAIFDCACIKRKFGYDHVVEMVAIRAALAAQGISGTELHFAAVKAYEVKHAGDPTYRERCDARPINARPDPLLEALRLIRDGHNDPSALAREVLFLYEAPKA